MAKLIVVAMASVDGYYEGPGGAGDLEPCGVDDGFNDYNAEMVRKAASVVVGHSSFKDFSSYWPEREQATDASDGERRFAAVYNTLPKLVFSRDPGSVDVPNTWTDSTRVVGGDVEAEVRGLKDRTSADDGVVIIWGSHDLWSQLWRSGLVDELHVVAGTGIAGGGTPVFPDAGNVRLSPLETRVLEKSHCVLTTYRVG